MDLRQVGTIVARMQFLLARREPFDRGGQPGELAAHRLERGDRIVDVAGRLDGGFSIHRPIPRLRPRPSENVSCWMTDRVRA